MSSTTDEAVIIPTLVSAEKYLSGRVVEPVTASKVAKQGSRVQTPLWEAEERGIASVPTTYRRKGVELPSMSVFFEDSQHLRYSKSDSQRTRVRDQGKTSIYSRAEAWRKTIFENNLNDLPNADTCFNTGRIKIAVDMAVADAGATGHFVLPGTPVIDVLPTSNPISINLPDGSVIKSTHTCRINIPWLPESATRAHIVPGLAHTSLISIAVLCDAGCKVTYDDDECKVYFKGKVV